jgi:cellulose synthase (UDP-forming)
MGSERRQHHRIPVPMPVTLELADGSAQRLTSVNVSDGGVLLEHQDEAAMPPEGSEVVLRLAMTLGDGEAPPDVPARVIRVDAETIALAFIESNDD